MFYVLQFEIGILVLNTCVDPQHIIMVHRWRCGTGRVYPETMCIHKQISLDHFPNLSRMMTLFHVAC